MRSAIVPFSQKLELSKEYSGSIDHFLWLNNGYAPKSGFSLCYNEQALKVRLFSLEKPRFIKAMADEEAVWEDNCLEFFFAPFGDGEDYINFECNPLGNMVIQKGKSRYDRLPLTCKLKPAMQVKTFIEEDRWSVEYLIPFSKISAFYGKPFAPKKGEEFRFNAYLCGDLAEPPRYGAWNPIDLPAPDFHCPQFFGKGVWG